MRCDERASSGRGEYPRVRPKAGVAIVTMAKGGLMYEASVGGQKFSYRPIGK
jgi:hypothetical protein